MAEKSSAKIVDLFQHLHTPEFVKTLLYGDERSSIRPTNPDILQVEMIDWENFECYHYPDRHEIQGIRMLEHHLRCIEKIPEERIPLLIAVMTDYHVAEYHRWDKTVHPVIKPSKLLDD